MRPALLGAQGSPPVPAQASIPVSAHVAMVTVGISEAVTHLDGLVSSLGVTLSDCWSWQLVTRTLQEAER